MTLVFSCAYLIPIFSALFSGKMLRFEGDTISFTDSFYLFIWFGIADSVFTMIASIINRHELSNIVKRGVIVFVPLDFILLVGQLLFLDVTFVSLTYVLPMLIFYLLFHSNPYNAISGCQNSFSFETVVSNAILKKQKYITIHIIFPRLKDLDLSNLRNKMIEITKMFGREFEGLQRNVRIYELSPHSYVLFLKTNSEDFAKDIFQRTVEITNKIQKSFTLNNIQIYHCIATYNAPVKNYTEYNSLIRFLSRQFVDSNENQSHFSDESDYEAFLEYYQIEQLLLDIRNQYNLDDERIICYTQPIYSVHDDCFRTAEALMRLSMDGRIIYPDKFIPLAEQNGCIHILTCIMLNKVCKKIASLDDAYDFDAITINCSTTEMADRNLSKELLSIISKNNVSTKRIRLELTESAMFNDYEILHENMNLLSKAGVAFYLDDFGTGYSNLERIISCPFMTIKFDKSLLYKSLSNQTLEELVVNMVNIFKKAGFVVLIEGVEDDIQSEYSIDRGFEYIQGYKYAKPVPIEQLDTYLKKKTIDVMAE